MRPGPDGIALRAMTVDDVAAVAAIDRQSFALPWSENSFRSDLTNNPAAHLLVAQEADGLRRVVGYVGFWLVVDEAHVGTLAVAPDLRRRGIGERVLRAAMGEAARLGAEMMTLEVRVSNQAARRLYEKLGFQVVGRRPRYYMDNFEDAILMTRDRLPQAVRAAERAYAG